MHREPILDRIFHIEPLLSELVELGEDRRGQHILDHDLACSLLVKEEEELTDCSDDIERVEVLL